MEFIDVNPALSRILKSHVDDDSHAPNRLSSPWRKSLPTLTGSCKVVVRWLSPDGIIQLRALEGWEYFRLIGWDDSMWWVSRQPRAEERPDDYADLVRNMAGNAYSFFHYAPWMLATIATYRKFWNNFCHGTMDNDEQPEVVADSDGSMSS